MDITLGKVLTYSESLPSLKTFDHVTHRSHDNLKKLYFHNQKMHDQQTWQGAN